jgi:hypothetical protein
MRYYSLPPPPGGPRGVRLTPAGVCVIGAVLGIFVTTGGLGRSHPGMFLIIGNVIFVSLSFLLPLMPFGLEPA